MERIWRKMHMDISEVLIRSNHPLGKINNQWLPIRMVPVPQLNC
jgi:hypothetical protein